MVIDAGDSVWDGAVVAVVCTTEGLHAAVAGEPEVWDEGSPVTGDDGGEGVQVLASSRTVG